MQSLSIVAALAIRARTRARVKTLQEKQRLAGRAAGRASAESLGPRVPKPGAGAA
jgi:hypothetical protein